MQDYNKVGVRRQRVSRFAALMRAMSQIPMRYYAILLMVLSGFAMHLTSQVLQPLRMQDRALVAMEVEDQQQDQVATLKSQIDHSVYRTVVKMGLSAQQALEIEAILSKQVNLTQDIHSTDILQVLVDKNTKRLLAIELVQNKVHWLFVHLPKSDGSEFWHASKVELPDLLDIKEVYSKEWHVAEAYLAQAALSSV